MRTRPAIIVAVALACAPAYAGGDSPLAKARHDVDSSDYLSARTDLVAALDAGTASPDELAEIYKLTGIVEAALGNQSAATSAFERWIALDPRAALPEGTSPKITRPFDAATRAAPGKLELKPETRADPPHLAIVVASDPLKLVARARVLVSVDGGPERRLEATGHGRLDVDLPRGRRLDIRVEALDSHGNRVALIGSRDVPIVITGNEPAPPAGSSGEPTVTGLAVTAHPSSSTTSSHRPFYLSYWLWGGATVALAAGGTYFGLQARDAADELRQLNANSQSHPFSDAVAIQDRGNRDALLCNIGLISAGAFAIVTGILVVTAPHAHAETRVGAVPVRGGGALVVGGSF